MACNDVPKARAVFENTVLECVLIFADAADANARGAINRAAAIWMGIANGLRIDIGRGTLFLDAFGNRDETTVPDPAIGLTFLEPPSPSHTAALHDVLRKSERCMVSGGAAIFRGWQTVRKLYADAAPTPDPSQAVKASVHRREMAMHVTFNASLALRNPIEAYGIIVDPPGAVRWPVPFGIARVPGDDGAALRKSFVRRLFVPPYSRHFPLSAADAANQRKYIASLQPSTTAAMAATAATAATAAMRVNSGDGNAATPACAVCRKSSSPSAPLLKCGRCRRVSYCSPECQRKDWTIHRPHCTVDVSVSGGDHKG